MKPEPEEKEEPLNQPIQVDNGKISIRELRLLYPRV